jgi:hypothetical protein
MTIARGHHWISQTYLARFTADGRKESKLHVVDLAQRKVFDTAPANVCKERDFNTIESDTLPPDELEKGLSKIEGWVGQSLTNILGNPASIAWEDWNAVLNFMALLATRNPIVRAHVTKKASEDKFNKISDATDTPENFAAAIASAKAGGYTSQESQIDYEEFRAHLSPGMYAFEFPPGYFVPNEFEAMDFLLRQLGQRRWQVVEAPADSPGFVLTDRPLTPFRRDSKHPSIETPVDFGSDDTIAFFPLSPRFAGVGVPGIAQRSVPLAKARRDFVAIANFTMIRICTQRVFAPNALFEVLPAKGCPVVVGDEILQLFGDWEDGSAQG